MNMNYVLITAARNEESYIEKTIETVIAQTVLPKRWVIVSDGSTDRTDEIVKQYAENNDFIRLLRMEPDCQRNFASKVYAVRAGLEQFEDIQYDIIGNLDADVTFGPNYYEYVLNRFSENDKLGIAGGVLYESYKGKIHKQHYYNKASISGAVQTFRRQCYEDIGGYFPLQTGGEDTVAEVTARMHGWQTRAFLEIPVLHHRRTGTAVMNIWATRFDEGYRDAMFGNHPVYHMVNCAYKMLQPPFFMGGALRMCGYLWASIAGGKRKVSKEFVKHIRWEQMRKLESLVFSK